MSQPIVVRKYENRRLYDTSSSRYVNLLEIAQLIREGAEVEVVDAKSGEDITPVILTQIIHEEARHRKGDLPLPFLRELVVTSDRALRDFVAWYADAALSAQRGATEVFPPLARVLPFLERTLEALKQKAAPGAARLDEKPGEVEELRARVAELEARLASRGAPRAEPAPGGVRRRAAKRGER